MDFLTQEQKNFASNLLNTSFDTFKREILIIESEQVTIVSSNINDNFPLFRGQDQPLETQTTIISSGIYQGTIAWLNTPTKQQLLRSFFDTENGGGGKGANASAISANQDKSIVKISMPTGAGFDAIDKCESIILDKDNYIRMTSPRNRGLFHTNYYDLYFIEND